MPPRLPARAMLLGAALLLPASGCRPRPAHAPPTPAAPAPAQPAGDRAAPESTETVTLTGLLEVVTAADPSGPAMERYALFTAAGRVQLLMTPEQFSALGVAARRPGTRATVVAVRTTADVPTVRVITISLIPPGA